MLNMIFLLLFVFAFKSHAHTYFDLNETKISGSEIVKGTLLFSSKNRTKFSYFDESKNKNVIVDIPVKICKYHDGKIQPFRLQLVPGTELYSVIALGADVRPEVALISSSICNYRVISETKVEQDIFPFIEGTVTIANSYIEGGIIQGTSSGPDGKKNLPSVDISNSNFKGDFIIKNRVRMDVVTIKGNPIIEGNIGDGIFIANTTLDYSNITDIHRGIYGSVSLTNVKAKGNILIQTTGVATKDYLFKLLPKRFSSDAFNKIPKSVREKVKNFEVSLENVTDVTGDITIKNKVMIWNGTLKGNFLIDGNKASGIFMINPTIDYGATTSELNKITGHVDFFDAIISGQPTIVGEPTLVSKALLKEVDQFVFKHRLTEEDKDYILQILHRVKIEDAELKKTPQIYGQVLIHENSVVDGNYIIKGRSSLVDGANTDSSFANSKLIQADLSKTSQIQGWVRLNNTNITGSPAIEGIENGDYGILFSSSIIHNDAQIKGNLNFYNIEFKDTTLINSPGPTTSGISGSIEKVILTGTNNLFGNFGISSSLNSIHNITVNNLAINNESSVAVLGASLGSDVILNGYVTIDSGCTIGQGVQIFGKDNSSVSCESCKGIGLEEGTEVYGSTTVISGNLSLRNAYISNSNINIYKPYLEGRSSWIIHSTVDGADISGAIGANGATITTDQSGVLSCDFNGCTNHELSNYENKNHF